MTMKKLFEKLEMYNEVAELMHTSKAHIYFSNGDPESTLRFGEAFSYYNEFRKYVRNEFNRESAEFILKSSDWDFDKDVEFSWSDSFLGRFNTVFCAELSAD